MIYLRQNWRWFYNLSIFVTPPISCPCISFVAKARHHPNLVPVIFLVLIYGSLHTLSFCKCFFLLLCIISKYGSTLYVGIAWKNNGTPYISVASDELKSLLKLKRHFTLCKSNKGNMLMCTFVYYFDFQI